MNMQPGWISKLSKTIVTEKTNVLIAWISIHSLWETLTLIISNSKMNIQVKSSQSDWKFVLQLGTSYWKTVLSISSSSVGSSGWRNHSHLLLLSGMHLRRIYMSAAIWLWWSLWWPMALAILDKLHHTSPQPLCKRRCWRRGRSMTSIPALAIYRNLVALQLRMSSRALQSRILLSSGICPPFKHCAIRGANSNMAASRPFLFKPSAVIVGWSSLFTSMQMEQVGFWHLVLTSAISPPPSWHRQYGQLWSSSSWESLTTGSPRQVQSAPVAVQTSRTLRLAILVRSSV